MKQPYQITNKLYTPILADKNHDLATKMFWTSVVQGISKGYMCKSCIWDSIKPLVTVPLADKEHWKQVNSEMIAERVMFINRLSKTRCPHFPAGPKCVHGRLVRACCF